MGCAFGRIVPEIKSGNDSNWEKGVNNIIRSRGESNLEKRESVHSFSSVVDNAIRSANNSDSKPPENVSSFSLVVDNAIRSANNSDRNTVNKAIRNRDGQAETDAEADTAESANRASWQKRYLLRNRKR
ncbi:hypothetical protein PHAVU_006G211100 [Phaseolus vulgaris]|uniref:Uncharacterized protein n=1 Tax=Phaseolus vulgaris TaxID=3885 RepID=V7BR67_PHAVU|nr:hypothetical protein PHAVU_006G211100g [Phaseolus vulgaris]ESW20459.1 hypothetical protein PHAVU_006G211100g [Phaseolus vulgaris]